MSQKILKFKATSGFGKWKRYFPESAVSHPAKINLNLLEYLILNYTKEGDTVLDCMCGTGSTVVLSMLKNRNAIGIDLEEKFTIWAKRAIKNVEQQQTLTPKGKGMVICGDSRKLSELLKVHKEEISSVIFSPPYKTANKGGGLNKNLPKTFRGVLRNHSFKLSDNPNNIDNLPFMDVAIFSPPYSDRSEHRVGYDYQVRDVERGYKPYHGFREQYGSNPENIGSLTFNVPIFSPPYGLGHDSGDNASEEYGARLKEQMKHTRVYGNRNISQLPFIATILFSPPYATSKAFHDLQFMDRTSNDFSDKIRKGEIKGHFMSGEARRRVFERCKEGEIENNENIGYLPFGFNTIISSPPYSEIRMDGGTQLSRAGMIPYTGESADTWRTQRDQKNIGNLQHGVIEEVIDACLLSPPYFSSVSAETDANKRLKRLEREGYLDSKEWQTPNTIKTLGREAMFSKNRYSKDINNIGNIRELGISVAVFSPPYEKTVKDHGKSDRATKINVEKSISSSFAYSGDSNNIGNKNKETYLSAMKTVYEQCFLVLKPQGLLILILKNFIRDKKVVKLTDHTIRLCEGVGFKLKERLLFRLPTQSFWRRLYAQKYPEVNTSDLRYEHILIFEKKEQNGKNEWA